KIGDGGGREDDGCPEAVAWAAAIEQREDQRNHDDAGHRQEVRQIDGVLAQRAAPLAPLGKGRAHVVDHGSSNFSPVARVVIARAYQKCVGPQACGARLASGCFAVENGSFRAMAFAWLGSRKSHEKRGKRTSPSSSTSTGPARPTSRRRCPFSRTWSSRS